MSALFSTQPKLAHKNPLDKPAFRQLDTELGRYFENLELHSRPELTPPTSNMLDQLRGEQEFSETYNERLFKTYCEMSKLDNRSLQQDVVLALKQMKGRSRVQLALPPAQLDPLLLAYEQKIGVLESEVR